MRSPAVLLGLRLAVGTPGQRTRTALVTVATCVSAWLLLSTLAVGAAISATDNGYSSVERERLAWSIVGAVVLPVLMLVGSVGRLSASVRDRRLANLRMLGLPASATRAVAASEAGVAAVAGVLAGAVLYGVTRPALADLSLAGHRWDPAVLDPGPVGWLLALVGVPVLVAAAAVLPVRGRSTAAMALARRADTGRPSLWWALPLVAGIALCLVQVALPRDENPGNGRFVLFFAGCILTGLGIVLVAPWVVRGVADLLVRRAPGPVWRIAGRRLQAQPSGVVRVTSALMIGLFLVTGARSVLVAFEDMSQYADADAAIHSAQRIALQVPARQSEGVAARARTVPGVSDVIMLPQLTARTHEVGPSTSIEQTRAVVLVATCAQLLRVQPELRGCVDGPMATHDGFPYTGALEIRDRGRTVARLPEVRHRLTSPSSDTWPGALAPLEASFVVPPDTPGIQALLRHAPRSGLVVGGPGRDLPAALATVHVFADAAPDYGYYDFVQGLRAILRTVAAVVLGVGMLTLGLGSADRAVARRRELAALRIVGTSPSVLRKAQLVEAAIPTVTGSLLAIGSGLLAGTTYLRMADLDRHGHVPWTSTMQLASISVVVALVIAGVTVVATNVRLSPDLIRQE